MSHLWLNPLFSFWFIYKLDINKYFLIVGTISNRYHFHPGTWFPISSFFIYNNSSVIFRFSSRIIDLFFVKLSIMAFILTSMPCNFSIYSSFILLLTLTKLNNYYSPIKFIFYPRAKFYNRLATEKLIQPFWHFLQSLLTTLRF